MFIRTHRKMHVYNYTFPLYSFIVLILCRNEDKSKLKHITMYTNRRNRQNRTDSNHKFQLIDQFLNTQQNQSRASKGSCNRRIRTPDMQIILFLSYNKINGFNNSSYCIISMYNSGKLHWRIWKRKRSILQKLQINTLRSPPADEDLRTTICSYIKPGFHI